MGIWISPQRMLNGTANSRGSRFLKRSTTIDRVLNTKLHTTPKAYASPSKIMSPRLTTMVNNCKTVISSRMRLVGAVALVRLEEPIGQYAVFGHAA